MKTRLDQFDASVRLERGRPKVIEITWYLLKCFFFLTPLPWPSAIKAHILRAFGAKVGHGVVIKPRVNIHFPWKLELGDHVWIGEEVFILNFEPVTIASHCCLSQRAFLCAGNHDFRDVSFRYRNAPIALGRGAWIGAQAFVAPGTKVGEETVVAAGAIVSGGLDPNAIYSGNPAKVVGQRWPQPESS